MYTSKRESQMEFWELDSLDERRPARICAYFLAGVLLGCTYARSLRSELVNLLSFVSPISSLCTTSSMFFSSCYTPAR